MVIWIEMRCTYRPQDIWLVCSTLLLSLTIIGLYGKYYIGAIQLFWLCDFGDKLTDKEPVYSACCTVYPVYSAIRAENTVK